MRNSDPDATVYWLARMIESGEDPLYIARRLVRFASEDIGNADPRALSIAVAAKDAVHFVGMPEGNTALAQAAIYMAVAAKSNAVYRAYLAAAEAASTELAEPVPLHLRNAPTRLMKALDYGKGYRYAHDEAEGVAADMVCLPPAHAGRRFYEPTDRGLEAEIERSSRSSAAGVARPRRSRISRPLFHFPQHLGAERQDEREAIVALHTADRDPDEIAVAIQHAAAGNARMAIGEARDQIVPRSSARRNRSTG